MMQEIKNKLLSLENLESGEFLPQAEFIADISRFSSSYDVGIYLATTNKAKKYIIKYGKPRIKDQFIIEAKMLCHLDEQNLSVPKTYYTDNELIVMDYIEGGSSINSNHQRQMARMLAKLHSVKRDYFGFEYDTIIGALPQPNTRHQSWLSFFKEERVLFMATYAYDRGNITKDLLARIEQFAHILDRYIDEPDHPSLIHGDIWAGNVICNDNKIAGLIDPAIYYAHPEIELAFMTMFGSFNQDFFHEYANFAKFDKSFFEIRRDIYNIYPLLVHVLLCGSSYIYSIEKLLKRLGL